ncbi:MAG: alpha/beta hydrolase [Gammaproteobacteria bacterium]
MKNPLLPGTGNLRIGVLFGALLLSACSSPKHQLDLMPAPAAYEGASEPFNELIPEAVDPETHNLDMLFATNRAPAEDGDANGLAYSGERGYLLRVGSASITFGDPEIAWEQARSISLVKNRPSSFPLAVDKVTEYGILENSVSVFTPPEVGRQVDKKDAEKFVRQIETRLARSSVKDVFIYVHGYKVDFENPLLVASELWHFLGYEGAFVAFSWPSTPARLAYMKDIETARVSAWGLRKLIHFLAENTSAERIHILGYSAGTRVVMNALYEMALIYQSYPQEEISERIKLGNLILVGSDIDTGLFASYVLDGLLRVQDRLTLYASPADKALKLSETIFNHRRVGEVLAGTLDNRMREFVASSSRLAMVDVGNAANFDAGNGHAYFRKSPWVSSDILMTLRYGLSPGERGLSRSDESPIWRFPEDYVERFEAALQAVNPRFRAPEADAGAALP